MTGYPRRYWVLAACLAGLAGYVDALGFLKLGGFFVSFMSGNSTRLGVGIVTNVMAAKLAGGLVAAFLSGTIAGALVGSRARIHRKPVVLLLVAGLLLVAAIVDTRVSGPAAAYVLAAAMGSENAVFQRDGEVSIALTYMTGTLVKLGQRIAAALQGGEAWAWVPHAILWCSLTAGTVIGATMYLRYQGPAIWGAGLFAIILALYATAIGPINRDAAP